MNDGQVDSQHDSQGAEKSQGHPRGKQSIAVLLFFALGGLAVGTWLVASWYFRPAVPEGSGSDSVSSSSSSSSLTSPDDEKNGESKNRVERVRYVPPSDDGFVGSNACIECHAEISESYQQHPMYWSTRRVDEDRSPPPSSSKPVAGRRRQLTAKSENGEMIHHELMYDEQGELVYDDSLAMQYVVGAGRRAKAYLLQHDDILCTSPLNWFAEDQQWGLNPGYVADDPRRFDRRVVDICLVCHAGRLQPVSRNTNRYDAQQPFHEVAIGCERCHGPGQEHIAFHRESADGQDPIVNPAKLESGPRESVCYQCHLQPSSARILRHGRSHLDFRPGDNIEDIWTILETGTGVGIDGRTDPVRHVQQMRDSRCYQASDMSCVSCHDPHSVPQAAARETFYRERCFQCHDDQSCVESMERRQRQNDSCIACHMPANKVRLSSHVSQTDHRILRRPSQKRPARVATGGMRFFDEQDQRLDREELRRAIVLAQVAASTRSALPFTSALHVEVSELLKLFPDDGPLLLAGASLSQSAGDLRTAIARLEEARMLAESEEVATNNLMDIAYRGGDWQRTLNYADRLLAINPTLSRAYALKADALFQLGRTEEAIAAAEAALKRNPSLISVHMWLAKAYEALGRTAKQLEQQQRIERMQRARPPRQPAN